MMVDRDRDERQDNEGQDRRTSPAPSRRLASIHRVEHGGVYVAQERAFQAAGVVGDMLDVSVNSNPYGPPPAVLSAIIEAINGATLERYPDPAATLLVEALAQRLHLLPDMILVGNGSAELFWTLALAYLDPGAEVLVLGPAFSEYAIASQVAGARVRDLAPSTNRGPRWDAELVEAVAAQASGASLLWLANPANPTGQYLTRDTVQSVLEAFPGLVVLDEAYVNFVADAWDSTPLLQAERLAIVRSMTKEYALAGLRLGYVLAPPAVVGALKQVRIPWSVNALAQIAGLAALSSGTFLEESRQRLLRDCAALRTGLDELGWSTEATDTHYFLARVPEIYGTATAAKQVLLDRGIMVRDCASFGLPAHVRIATRQHEDNDTLLARLAAETEASRENIPRRTNT
jgi:histidinol-phosphate aminotransferase